VKGAAASTVVAYLIACILDFISVEKYTKAKLNTWGVFIKPLISAVGMAVMAGGSYMIALPLIGDKLSTIVGIFVGVISYFLLLMKTGSVTYEDFKLFPKGHKIAKKLVKIKLLKES
jgi:stage V sporulation protein B